MMNVFVFSVKMDGEKMKYEWHNISISLPSYVQYCTAVMLMKNTCCDAVCGGNDPMAS